VSRPSGAARCIQRGFSIVELMVALTLGLVVTGAVIATFVGMHSASGLTSSESVVADNGRIALDVIQQALRSAGYMACNNTGRQSVVLGVAPTPMTYDFTEALSGYEAVGTGPTQAVALVEAPAGDGNLNDWVSSALLGNSLDPSVTAVGALPVQGSDVVAIHTTYSQVQPVFTTALSGTNATTVQSSTGLVAGQLAIVSNCANSVIDQISSTGATVTYAYPLQNSFTAGSQVAVADTIVFYIGVGADGDGALYSYELAPNATFATPSVEVVPDVENMQILYGVDTTGTYSISEYVTADQVTNAVAANPNCLQIPGSGAVAFNCVISIKVAMLAASPPGAVPLPAAPQVFNLLGTQVTAPLDTRARQSFDMTISLRNTTT
jgi:type IV pilus assembly protein PilW